VESPSLEIFKTCLDKVHLGGGRNKWHYAVEGTRGYQRKEMYLQLLIALSITKKIHAPVLSITACATPKCSHIIPSFIFHLGPCVFTRITCTYGKLSSSSSAGTLVNISTCSIAVCKMSVWRGLWA